MSKSMVDVQIQEYKDMPTEEKKNLMISLVKLASDNEPAKPSPRVRVCLILQHCVNVT